MQINADKTNSVLSAFIWFIGGSTEFEDKWHYSKLRIYTPPWAIVKF